MNWDYHDGPCRDLCSRIFYPPKGIYISIDGSQRSVGILTDKTESNPRQFPTYNWPHFLKKPFYSLGIWTIGIKADETDAGRGYDIFFRFIYGTFKSIWNEMNLITAAEINAIGFAAYG